MTAPDLAFLHCDFYPRCRAWVDKRFEGYYTLQYMDAGAIELAYDHQLQRLEGAWFWTAFPGPRIRFHCAPGHPHWVHRYVAFKGARIERWRRMGLWMSGPQPAPKNRDYALLFDELLAEARRNERWSQCRGANLLEGILIELARARKAPPAREPWLETVLEAFEEVLRRSNSEGEGASLTPDYARLARQLKMGLSTLRRRFLRATGLPLHDYFLKRRVEIARQLLGETDRPMKRIAQQLGYGDVYFFSRQFKEVTGVPPGQYRRSRQE